jgi:hypothetical protein
MRLRRGNQDFVLSAVKSVLMTMRWTLKRMMTKLFRLIFQPYMEDDYGSYYHNGIGYTGVTYSPDQYARKKHKGIGYTGVYYE